MRWYWVDRFTEFVRATRAVAIKNITLAEEHLHDQFPSYPVHPESLIVEGIAQTAGLLIAEYGDFDRRVVLAKIGKAIFHRAARPGDQLVFTITVNKISFEGASVSAESRIDGELHAEIDLFFAHLEDEDLDNDLFLRTDFVRWTRIVGIYDVGVDEEGRPLQMPEHLARAEAAALSAGKA